MVVCTFRYHCFWRRVSLSRSHIVISLLWRFVSSWAYTIPCAKLYMQNLVKFSFKIQNGHNWLANYLWFPAVECYSKICTWFVNIIQTSWLLISQIATIAQSCIFTTIALSKLYFAKLVFLKISGHYLSGWEHEEFVKWV